MAAFFVKHVDDSFQCIVPCEGSLLASVDGLTLKQTIKWNLLNGCELYILKQDWLYWLVGALHKPFLTLHHLMCTVLLVNLTRLTTLSAKCIGNNNKALFVCKV